MRGFRRRRRTDYDFEIELDVRDSECDLQGVVNNAVHQHYFEHARHRFLLANGFDFARLHEAGCDLVVASAEVDYMGALRPGDHFVVCSTAGRESPLRFVFEQEIFRLPDDERVTRARFVGTGIIDGKPGLPEELIALLGDASTPDRYDRRCNIGLDPQHRPEGALVSVLPGSTRQSSPRGDALLVGLHGSAHSVIAQGVDMRHLRLARAHPYVGVRYVGDNEAPTTIITAVGVGGVQGVAIEEQHRARRHLAMHFVQFRHGEAQSFGVGDAL